MSTNVLEAQVASIFKVEEKANQETSVKAGLQGDMFLQNIG
jgi:hypothetical protein